MLPLTLNIDGVIIPNIESFSIAKCAWGQEISIHFVSNNLGSLQDWLDKLQSIPCSELKDYVYKNMESDVLNNILKVTKAEFDISAPRTIGRTHALIWVKSNWSTITIDCEPDELPF